MYFFRDELLFLAFFLYSFIFFDFIILNWWLLNIFGYILNLILIILWLRIAFLNTLRNWTLFSVQYIHSLRLIFWFYLVRHYWISLILKTKCCIIEKACLSPHCCWTLFLLVYFLFILIIFCTVDYFYLVLFLLAFLYFLILYVNFLNNRLEKTKKFWGYLVLSVLILLSLKHVTLILIQKLNLTSLLPFWIVFIAQLFENNIKMFCILSIIISGQLGLYIISQLIIFLQYLISEKSVVIEFIFDIFLIYNW